MANRFEKYAQSGKGAQPTNRFAKYAAPQDVAALAVQDEDEATFFQRAIDTVSTSPKVWSVWESQPSVWPTLPLVT